MTTSNEAANEKKKIYLQIVAVILVLVFAVAPLLYSIWEDRAYNLTVTNKEVIQIQNGDRLFSVNSTVIVENYVPFLQTSVDAKITERFSNKTTRPITNNNASLIAKDIEIDSIAVSQMYGNEEVYPTFTVKKPENFSDVSTFGMSVTTISINWRYNITQGKLAEVEKIRFSMIDDRVEYSDLGRLALYLFSFLIFAGIGCEFSWFAFGEAKFREAYGDLLKFNHILKKNGNDKTFKDCHGNLKKLVGFPKGMHTIKKYFFGISVVIFKIAINNRCKKHLENLNSYEIAPYKKTSLKKTLDKYTKRVLEKIEDNMPELKTIIIATTFLTSIGISFSWNVGAITSVLISLGLFYLFINIGSTFYLVGKSNEELGWTIAIFSLSVFVILFPILIEIARHPV